MLAIETMVNVYIRTKPFVLINGGNMLEDTKEKRLFVFKEPQKRLGNLNYGIS